MTNSEKIHTLQSALVYIKARLTKGTWSRAGLLFVATEALATLDKDKQPRSE